jgi:putative photosynthetic complex assembly protein
MSELSVKGHAEQTGTPRALLLGALALVSVTIVGSGLARITDVGASRMPSSTAVDTILLRFDDLDDGGVAVRNAADGSQIYKVEPAADGFIRGAMRGLVRERKRSGIGAEIPFKLTRWSDGTLSLQDETSGRRIDLDAFGPSNAGAFAQFFATQEPLK